MFVALNFFFLQGDIALCDAKLDDDDSITNPTLPGIIIQKDKFVVCKTNGIDLKGLCACKCFHLWNASLKLCYYY